MIVCFHRVGYVICLEDNADHWKYINYHSSSIACSPSSWSCTGNHAISWNNVLALSKKKCKNPDIPQRDDDDDDDDDEDDDDDDDDDDDEEEEEEEEEERWNTLSCGNMILILPNHYHCHHSLWSSLLSFWRRLSLMMDAVTLDAKRNEGWQLLGGDQISTRFANGHYKGWPLPRCHRKTVRNPRGSKAQKSHTDLKILHLWHSGLDPLRTSKIM